MPLSGLLPPRSFIQRDPLHRCGIVEIRYVRIVERDMPVLPETDERKVDRRRVKKLRVSPHFGIQVGGISGQVIRFARVCLLLNARPDPMTKAGRMIGFHTRILVHVKYLYSLPIELALDESFDERELGISSCDDYPRPVMFLDGVRDQLSRSRRRSRAQR